MNRILLKCLRPLLNESKTNKIQLIFFSIFNVVKNTRTNNAKHQFWSGSAAQGSVPYFFYFFVYDAALLTRCYTQHDHRPFIDSESNHIRHFITILYINKEIDFILYFTVKTNVYQNLIKLIFSLI